jgi:hypothetical protein
MRVYGDKYTKWMSNIHLKLIRDANGLSLNCWLGLGAYRKI